MSSMDFIICYAGVASLLIWYLLAAIKEAKTELAREKEQVEFYKQTSEVVSGRMDRLKNRYDALQALSREQAKLIDTYTQKQEG